jgi:hypothetical protein
MTQHFSILLHDHPWWHWDFLLENGDHALCWRLLREPCCGEPIAAESLEPHRLLYLDYQGPVSNDRGVVETIDRGTYQISASQPEFTIRLRGLNWAQQATLKLADHNRLFWNFS